MYVYLHRNHNINYNFIFIFKKKKIYIYIYMFYTHVYLSHDIFTNVLFIYFFMDNFNAETNPYLGLRGNISKI